MVKSIQEKIPCSVHSPVALHLRLYHCQWATAPHQEHLPVGDAGLNSPLMKAFVKGYTPMIGEWEVWISCSTLLFYLIGLCRRFYQACCVV